MHKKIITPLLITTLLIISIQSVTVKAVPKPSYTESDVIKIAKTLYGECRAGWIPTHEKAAVVWCILNRVDSPYYPNSIDAVITRSQFHGYSPNHPVLPSLEALARDVLARWYLEKLGLGDVGRTLPSNYLFFAEYKRHNRFRTSYRGNPTYWNWSLPNPYKK